MPEARDTTALFLWDVPMRLRDYLAESLTDRQDIRLVFPDDASDESLLALAPDAHVMVGWRPSGALLRAARNMLLFINPGVGVQHLLEPFQEINKKRNVRLANGHGNTYFTAQHTVALLLALTNKVVPHHGWMQDGQWRKGDAEAKSIPLRDRHIGLLGYGAVNRKVHRMLSGFDVRFSVLRRTGVVDRAADDDAYGPGAIHAFLEAIDILIVAVPLTPQTEGLIGADELSLLGAEGLLVNVARGPVVDEASLFLALQSGTIAGAGLDVWYDYRPEAMEDGRKFPYASPHLFHTLDNVVLSPHRAASPFDDLRRWDEVVDNLRRVADGRSDLRNIVDLDRGY